MITDQINLTDLKARIFLAVTILTLAIYQTLDSPKELTEVFPFAVFSWHLITMIVIAWSTKLLDQQIFRDWFRCSFGKIIVARLSVYLILSSLLTGITIVYYNLLVAGSGDSIVFLSAFVFYAVIYFITSVSLEVSKLVGKDFIGKLLLGAYHRPRNENRIFLFIDLTESTKLSKELDLQQYSLLIKEFFRDIDIAMEKHDGEIYQYAGDEMIVSWPDSKFNYDKAVQAFIKFHEQMKSKRRYYQDQFGVVPTYKAALHSGLVITTWVGRMKRELLFQGEVLNITARLTGLSKKLSYPLLLTKEIADHLSAEFKQQVITAGSYQLKGLIEPVLVYFLRITKDRILKNPSSIPADHSQQFAIDIDMVQAN